MFGHPKGLFFLAFTEAWERFSFYGMMALLVLYLVNQLLLPGHIENIAGFAGFRGTVERLMGPLSPVALASLIFGLYSGFVYFTPVFGGMIADRWIGQRNAVVIGALSMSAGHIAMAFDRTFLLALLLLVVGSGFLKGNIASQVGGLYDDDAQRTRGFAIFSMAINFGALLGPVVCGLLAQYYGAGIAAAILASSPGSPRRAACCRHTQKSTGTARMDASGSICATGMGVAFLYYWPPLLALVSRVAPARVSATMMGIAYLSLFLANNIIGWIGAFYERMGPVSFWLLHAAIACTGGLLILIFGGVLRRALESSTLQPMRAATKAVGVEG